MFGRLLGRQSALLASAPAFRSLFLATLGSGIGTWLAFIALQVDVQQRTHSGTWISALLIGEFVPAVLIGLLFGSFVDRFSRQRLMIGADLLRFGVFCALPFVGSATAIIGLATVAGFGTGFFRPAVYAGLPNLVPDRDLPDANSLLQSVENLTWAVAPPLGGVLVAVSGPHLAYWINAATFLVSAALVASIAGRRLQAAPAETHGHWRDLAEGIALVRRSRALLTVFVAWNVFMVASGGVNVPEIFLAKDSFNAGDFGFGLLVGATGLGLTVGSLAAAAALRQRGIATVYSMSIGIVALATGAAAASPNVWVAACFVAGAGSGNGAAVVCNGLLVQRGAPDRLRGRAFTFLMSSNFLVLVPAMVVAGRLTNAFGARWVWGGAAAAAGLSALLGLVLARRVPVHERGVEPEVEAAALESARGEASGMDA